MSTTSAAGPRPPAARRTQLFCPANRVERAPKAATSGADAVVLDLEDSVPVGSRVEARGLLVDGVDAVRTAGAASGGVPVLVRVNADDDLPVDVDAAVQAGADEVLVPKVESAERVREVEDLLDEAEARYAVPRGRTRVQLLVESPRGLLQAAAVAAAGTRVVAMALGGEDLATELEVDPASPHLDLRWAHGMLLCAARAHGLAAYGLLGSIGQIRDLDALRADAERSRGFGYQGSLCIHPAQVPVLHEAFSPAAEEVAHARAVLAALADGAGHGTAAVQLDGRMVDTAMEGRARRLLERAGET